MERILIAEDEPRVASFVKKGLMANGYTVTVAPSGDEALRLACSGAFDLLILDIGLPGLDGFAVLRELRRSDKRLPVVMLTARDTLADTVASLEGGADDYITKPFRFEELLARVRARLRDTGSPESAVLRLGDLALDVRSRKVRLEDREIELSLREFALAETFLRNPGHVLSRAQLLSHVWGYDYEVESNIVDVYVGYLRRKLGSDRIETVRGVGYRLTEPSAGRNET